jgi:WD40 repeat protein
MELKAHNGIILSLAVLPNGDLVSGSWDQTIKIWNTNDGSVKQTLTGHTGWIRLNVNSAINYFEMSVNGNLISASDKSIIIWI